MAPMAHVQKFIVWKQCTYSCIHYRLFRVFFLQRRAYWWSVAIFTMWLQTMRFWALRQAVWRPVCSEQGPSPKYNQVALGLPAGRLLSWLGRIFRAAEIAWQCSLAWPKDWVMAPAVKGVECVAEWLCGVVDHGSQPHSSIGRIYTLYKRRFLYKLMPEAKYYW